MLERRLVDITVGKLEVIVGKSASHASFIIYISLPLISSTVLLDLYYLSTIAMQRQPAPEAHSKQQTHSILGMEAGKSIIF